MEALRVLVIDSNVLIQNQKPSNALRLLGKEANSGRVRVVIPEVVILETARKHREKVEKTLLAYRSHEEDLGKLIDIERSHISVDLEHEEVARADLLREKILKLGATLDPVPTPSHTDLLQKALRKEKPFTSKDSGYRDALIWETVKKLAGEGHHVTLISEDRRAFFAESPEEGLAPSLAAEVEGMSGDVELSADLRAILEAVVAPDVLLLDGVSNAFTEKPVEDRLLDMLGESLRGESIGDRFSASDLDLDKHELASDLDERGEIDWIETGTAHVDVPEVLVGVNVLSARSLESREVAVELEIEVDAAIEIPVTIGSTSTHFDYRSGDFEHRQSETTTEVWKPRTLLVSADALFNPESRELSDLVVNSVSA